MIENLHIFNTVPLLSKNLNRTVVTINRFCSLILHYKNKIESLITIPIHPTRISNESRNVVILFIYALFVIWPTWFYPSANEFNERTNGDFFRLREKEENNQ